MSKASDKAAEKAEAINQIRKYVRPGDTVYGIVREVSRSGMSRTIDLYAVNRKDKDRPLAYLTGYAAKVLGYTRKDRGMLVGGCGMDMVFHCIYSLARAIFTNARAPRRPAPYAFRDFNPGAPRDGAWRKDRGYWLRAETL